MCVELVSRELIGTTHPDLEWKVIYVGSAESEKHDQVLEEVLVGPVPLGLSKFVLQVCYSIWIFCTSLIFRCISSGLVLRWLSVVCINKNVDVAYAFHFDAVLTL